MRFARLLGRQTDERRSQRLGLVAVALLAAAMLVACADEAPVTDVVGPAPAMHSPDNTTTTLPITPRPVGPTGPRCAELLAAASAEELAGVPVMSAVSRIPALSVFGRAVSSVPGLGETLEHASAVTILVPVDTAWNALAVTGESPMADATEELAARLQHHVAAGRYSLERLFEVSELTMIDGGSVTVGGDMDAPTFTDAAGDTAGTVCGNVATANGTLFMIDRVLETVD